MAEAKNDRVWTVAEAKSHLSEILRLTETEGPQRIGKRHGFVVMPADNGQEGGQGDPGGQMPINEWMLKNLTKHAVDVALPNRGGYRPIPFWDYATDAGLQFEEEWLRSLSILTSSLSWSARRKTPESCGSLLRMPTSGCPRW